MPSSPASPVVFIPGAWMGSWSWMPIARRLAASGRSLVTLDLPGLTYGSTPRGRRLDDAVACIVDALEDRDLRDAVLVCHSWGGYPATGAAARSHGRVRKVVYYNAVVPDPGVSMVDENAGYGDIVRQAIAARPDGDVPIDFESIAGIMMRSEPEALQRAVFDLTLPQPGGYMTEGLSADDLASARGIESAYILGADDIALARPGAEFAARLGMPVVEVPGEHLAMFTRPDDIAPAIEAACR